MKRHRRVIWVSCVKRNLVNDTVSYEMDAVEDAVPPFICVGNYCLIMTRGTPVIPYASNLVFRFPVLDACGVTPSFAEDCAGTKLTGAPGGLALACAFSL